MITQEYLKQLFKYNAETGIFTWIVDRKANKLIGKKCLTVGNHGYVTINLYGKSIYKGSLKYDY